VGCPGTFGRCGAKIPCTDEHLTAFGVAYFSPTSPPKAGAGRHAPCQEQQLEDQSVGTYHTCMTLDLSTALALQSLPLRVPYCLICLPLHGTKEPTSLTYLTTLILAYIPLAAVDSALFWDIDLINCWTLLRLALLCRPLIVAISLASRLLAGAALTRERRAGRGT
jgi:hypothetical protein